MIHPGERVDDKVVAQFARATAPRVTGLQVSFRGVDVGELAPAEPTALVDGEPFTIFGTYEAAGIGAVELRGTYEGERFFLEVPIDLPERDDRPAVTKLWAQARIRDLEHAALSGRRADTMKQRIVALAKEHGVSSKYTSFVVVEKRTGDRRVNEQAETRVVPVSAPADWGMFKAKKQAGMRACSMPMIGGAMPRSPASVPAPRAMMYSPSSTGGPPPPPMAAPGRSSPAARGGGGFVPVSPARAVAAQGDASDDGELERGVSVAQGRSFEAMETLAERQADGDPVTVILERQSASGMWEERGRDPIEVTVQILLILVRLGVTSSHPVHGAQTKKAVTALLLAVESAKSLEPKLAELAFAAVWLLSTGRRTRVAIKDMASHRPGLDALLALLDQGDDGVRTYVERIASV